MQNRIQIRRAPQAFVLDFLQPLLIRRLEHLVTRDVVALLADIVAHFFENRLVCHARALEQRNQIVRVEGAVGASVSLTWPGKCFGKQFLAAEWCIAAPTFVAVAADVAVGVADVVDVVFLEFVCVTLVGFCDRIGRTRYRLS